VSLLNYFVKIIYRSHLEVTSIVAALSFPWTLCVHPTLFTNDLEGEFSEVHGERRVHN
jgi:hypothetical protein